MRIDDVDDSKSGLHIDKLPGNLKNGEGNLCEETDGRAGKQFAKKLEQITAQIRGNGYLHLPIAGKYKKSNQRREPDLELNWNITVIKWNSS